MIKITFIALSVVLFICSCFHQGTAQNQEACTVADSIQIVNISWSYRSHGLLNVSGAMDIWEHTPDAYDTTIVEQDFNSKVVSRIGQLSTPLLKSKVDTRLVCFVYCSDKTVDTLSFGISHPEQYTMRLNSRYYEIDLELLEMLGSKLPEEDEQILKDKLYGILENKQ